LYSTFSLFSFIFYLLGPALLAFTFMMCAYSLRTWRRNGVACDELLFLPGTLHGHEIGVEGPLIEMPQQQPPPPSTSTSSQSESLPRETEFAAASPPPSLRHRSRSDVEEVGLSSLSSRTSSEDSASITPQSQSDNNNKEEPTEVDKDDDQSWDMNEAEPEEIITVQTLGLLHRNTGGGNADETNTSSTGPMQRWRENHPRLARLGTFFFFRSTSTTTQNAAYAPSGPSVFGAALDLSMPVLFNFHLFIEAFNHKIQAPEESDFTAKILPIIFLSVLMVRTMIPPSRRFRFWGTLKFTFTAPLHHVRFRDEFIGDVITSWVRPGQDLFFAVSYYLTVIYGTVSGKYGLTDSGDLLTESWLLHNVILPSFAILPLWLKYLQTLRQAYDTNKRWPYQGNSAKYLSATMVIIYAITHPENRSSPWYVASFLLTLFYQIWWDVFMDWELFEIQRDIQLVEAEQDSWCSRISSFRPSSHILLTLQMYLVQPALDRYQRMRASIPSWRQIQLRQKRLYKTEAFYWKIFAYNTVMRFTWMLCFIPAYHVSISRTVLTSKSDTNSYWGVLLPIAEIIRRTLWGFLCVERETIKLMDEDAKYSQVARSEEDDDEEDDDDDENSKFGDRNFRTQLLPTWLDNQQQVSLNAATSKAKQRDQFMRQLFVFELYAWAAAFVVLGCWAAS
jgi:hypothetical protein